MANDSQYALRGSYSLKVWNGDYWMSIDIKPVRKHIKYLAVKTRVPCPFGRSLSCVTQRAQRRLKGHGVYQDAPAPKIVVKTMIATGWLPENAQRIVWRDTWGNNSPPVNNAEFATRKKREHYSRDTW